MGELILSEAIRPSPNIKLIEHYRVDCFDSEEIKIPVVIATISTNRILDVLMDCIDQLTMPELNLVLESSHVSADIEPEEIVDLEDEHSDYLRSEIDVAIAKSAIYDYEDLILNDGCFGLAIYQLGSTPTEIHLDEHKMLIIYAQDLTPYLTILEEYGLAQQDDWLLIIEDRHVHSTTDEYYSRFEEFCNSINAQIMPNE